MISASQIKQMTREEKLQTMEAIWADLSRNETDLESPDWHAEALQATMARVNANQERYTDWETAKQELRKRFE